MVEQEQKKSKNTYTYTDAIEKVSEVLANYAEVHVQKLEVSEFLSRYPAVKDAVMSGRPNDYIRTLILDSFGNHVLQKGWPWLETNQVTEQYLMDLKSRSLEMGYATFRTASEEQLLRASAILMQIFRVSMGLPDVHKVFSLYPHAYREIEPLNGEDFRQYVMNIGNEYLAQNPEMIKHFKGVSDDIKPQRTYFKRS